MSTPIKLTLEPATYAWCTCLLSKNFPRCDGSHQTTDKKPFVETIDSAKDVYICACGKTNNAPFCDGSHKEQDKTNQ